MKSHVYEILESHEGLNKPWGTLWWNGKKIESDNDDLLFHMKDVVIHAKETLTLKDGPEFLDALPRHFKNGYMTVRKVG